MVEGQMRLKRQMEAEGNSVISTGKTIQRKKQDGELHVKEMRFSFLLVLWKGAFVSGMCWLGVKHLQCVSVR